MDEILRALPESELEALIGRLGIRIDPNKRIDVPSQAARALVGLPDVREPARLPTASRELLHRLAEAGGLLVVPVVPAGLEALLGRGVVYARKTGGGIQLVLPAAFLVQLKSWESEDPRSLRALIAQAPFETVSAIASHHLGRPATPPIALSLEVAWEVLRDPGRLAVEIDKLAPVERRLLEAVESVGGEVDTQELLDLEREPMRLRGAGGVTASRRGAGFALERRAFLIPIHPNRHAVPTEVATIVGAARRAQRDPTSEVNRVLVRDDPNLPRRVAELVRGEHELPYLAKAVSGTFDVDRCDYLLRDAHATGVRHGEFDLAWLLRSLRLRADDGDGAPGLAIDGAKGLSAIESFILARLFMFQQVYFHKSTRAAEWMIGAILRRAVALVRDGARLPVFPPAFQAAASGELPALDQYLELDDAVLLGAIHAWEDAKDPVLADLCKRLRARALFKTIEIFEAQRQGPAAAESEECRRALETAREISREAGLDPDIYVGIDVATDTPFGDDDSITVVYPRGRPRRPSEVSFLLDRLRGETVTRVRILFAPELRAAVREALIR